jgi:hypothetical protein
MSNKTRRQQRQYQHEREKTSEACSLEDYADPVPVSESFMQALRERLRDAAIARDKAIEDEREQESALNNLFHRRGRRRKRKTS